MHPRETIANSATPSYWRGLDELADTPAFRAMIEREFPDQAGVWTDAVSRRQFLTLMGASLALAGVGGCARPPAEKIVPYVRQPEQYTPGKALYFATAMPLAGSAIGLLVENHEGRPTKIEGNLDHPSSQGAADAIAQASVLSLYDPDRSQSLTFLGRIRGWNDTLAELQKVVAELRPSEGTGLRILSESVTSPTLAAQRDALLKMFGKARWHEYEPTVNGSAREGCKITFGDAPLEPIYNLADADTIVTLDADLLGSGPDHLRYHREFAARRKPDGPMNRLYAVESTPTGTGMTADHRLPLRAGQIEAFARALAGRLGVIDRTEEPASETQNRWIGTLAKELQERPAGRSVVIAGDGQPAAVHAIAHAINHKLGNTGKTVRYVKPTETQSTSSVESLRALTEDMAQGKVEVLLILGGNPVYTAPVDFDFKGKLAKVRLKIHLGLYDDETAEVCQWHIPEAHFLETWSDARAADGTATIMQPLIAPLYAGKSAHEVLAAFMDVPTQTGHELVKAYWQNYWQDKKPTSDFESFWRRSLHDGVIAGTASPTQDVKLKPDWAQAIKGRKPVSLVDASKDQYEIIFRADPTVFDGRFANNGWLQELPKPLTKLTWDNAIIVSPATAIALGIVPGQGGHGGSHGEVVTRLVELKYQDRTVRAPVFAQPGHPDGSVTVHLGYGRTRAGQVGTNVGFDFYALRTSAAPNFDGGATIQPTAIKYTLACTQFHHMLDAPNEQLDEQKQLEARGILRSMTLEKYKHPEPPSEAGEGHGKLPEVEGLNGRTPLTLYVDDKPPHHGPGWGMAIDLNSCIDCGGCVVACQSENNSPVVGKDQVTRGREMHWLRIDRYYKGEAENPDTYLQPMMCHHCENAPCEVVCPVEATSHSPDGLNEMTYNRCVGTKYCSNNCPYKVRRFNFIYYSDYVTASLKLGRNPEVTVRSVGVMEKCTFCVQRIRNAEIDAKVQHRELRDGDIVTACQAACPAEAIVFGDINDPKSRVSKLKASQRNYGVLSELNTRPRTSYLAAVRNPNPALSTR